MEGRRQGLGVQVLPGVSLLEVLIGEIGLDVGSFGLQVFDATRLVRKPLPLSPHVPALVLGVGVFELGTLPSDEGASALAPMADYLTTIYPEGHTVTVLEPRLASPTLAYAQGPIGELGSLAKQAPPDTCIFLDAVVPSLSGSVAHHDGWD